ncbi:L,D-transpeptidase [Aestuariivirga sp.]|uniref:L,D-transpeptidase n=1 Tax=Aestuariivirga sp. TaxID=2650926 RepID=UPI003BA95D10
MKVLVSRRALLAGSAALVSSWSAANARKEGVLWQTERRLNDRDLDTGVPPVENADPAYSPPDDGYFDSALLPPPESPIDFPIHRVSPALIKPRYRPQIVQFDGNEVRGTIVVDPENRFLYYVLADGQARRYGVGVGRAGFAWTGTAQIGMKRRWPRWVPPRQMVERDPNARKWKNGQAGGPDNPLGARALYLFVDGNDTLYRIHGTNEPASIGKAVSSGCIRMLNEDVAELFDLVSIGTAVIVRGSGEAVSAEHDLNLVQ